MAVNTPNSMREQPATGEATAPYRAEQEQAREPPRRIQVALVPRTGPQRIGEVQELLRKRLGILVFIILAFYAVQVVRSALALLQMITAPPMDWSALGFYAL